MHSADHNLLASAASLKYVVGRTQRSGTVKTGHLLYLAQMNRDAFNTMRRRGHLAFLDKHVGEGVSRFNEAHALALAALRYLQQIGLDAPRASEAVNESWPDIIRVVGLIDEKPRSERCGVRVNHLGLTDTWGWSHPQSRDGQPPVADAGVNLPILWEWLQPMLETVKGHTTDDGADD